LISSDLLNAIAALADAGRRTQAARELAAQLGARDLLVFMLDPEVGACLPAPGFPQVLPEVKAWRALVARATHDGHAAARVKVPGGAEEDANAIAGNGGSLLVLLGGQPDMAAAAEVARLLPLLAASFRGELTSLTAASQATLAREAAQQSRLLAERLDEARRTVQSALNEAKAAGEAKDRFLAVLSHELRSPLSPVLLSASLLQKDARLPPDLREVVERIKRNVELEARLIDDLLDLTRITHGKLQLHKTEVPGQRLLSQTLEMYRAEAHDKGVELDLELGAAHDGVLADQARLQQIFWNLIKNALKFTERGGRVAVRSFNDEENRFCVSVADTGIGIERARLRRIFEAFEQGSAAITQQFGGLGLGLSISKAMVDLHGGTIVAESEGKGRGATFTLRLPTIALADVSADGNGARPARDERGSRRLNILLVEDHADTGLMMKLLLKGFGHTVRYESTVEAAKSAASKENFDLLISDVGLPDGTGMDLMRELSGRYDLKGIALTGYGMEEDIRQCREAGFIEHFTKPIDPERLREAIDRVG
jgi:signal transduction histidine kinase